MVFPSSVLFKESSVIWGKWNQTLLGESRKSIHYETRQFHLIKRRSDLTFWNALLISVFLRGRSPDCWLCLSEVVALMGFGSSGGAVWRVVWVKMTVWLLNRSVCCVKVNSARFHLYRTVAGSGVGWLVISSESVTDWVDVFSAGDLCVCLCVKVRPLDSDEVWHNPYVVPFWDQCAMI